jgi:hypothetical protein
MCLQRYTDVHARNYCCRAKVINAVLHTRNVSVALVIQHAKLMRRVILPYVACLAVP